jgi:hypothetical protein
VDGYRVVHRWLGVGMRWQGSGDRGSRLLATMVDEGGVGKTSQARGKRAGAHRPLMGPHRVQARSTGRRVVWAESTGPRVE